MLEVIYGHSSSQCLSITAHTPAHKMWCSIFWFKRFGILKRQVLSMCHPVKSRIGTFSKKNVEIFPFFLSQDLNMCYPVESGRGTLLVFYLHFQNNYNLVFFYFHSSTHLKWGLVNLNLRGFCSNEMEDMGLKSHWCRCWSTVCCSQLKFLLILLLTAQ